ncbi:unnamed protein product [Staurois parvus]|uniref:Ribosomal protein S18 n=1 Tax=Staurois parvus TaxID=386267 RepID=A0ABN9ELG7_9NEOB|nr:unnamed protein product [Staurois parvus]
MLASLPRRIRTQSISLEARPKRRSGQKEK